MTTRTNDMIAQIDRKTGKVRYFAIRRFTPRECFRFMDVAEEDIDKLFATDENCKRLISNSAMYRLAANSIVVGCLSAIYENIFIKKDLEPVDENGQYMLF